MHYKIYTGISFNTILLYCLVMRKKNEKITLKKLYKKTFLTFD